MKLSLQKYFRQYAFPNNQPGQVDKNVLETVFSKIENFMLE